MQFEEVTERLGARVQYPGHTHDGLPMNVAIPSLGNVRIWQAVHGGYTWAIAYDPGLPEWSDEERARWAGYTASYRRREHNTSQETIRIVGGPWDSFTRAEAACRQAWRQVRSPH